MTSIEEKSPSPSDDRARGLGRTFTAVSFIVMLAATAYVLVINWPGGGYPFLAWRAHAGALAALCLELATRAFKIQASAHSIGERLSFRAALRVCLAGDFAASITPARSGAEPARFLILAEAGVSIRNRVVILYLELFLEMLSLVLVCMLLALLFRESDTPATGILALAGGYSVFVLSVGAAGYLLSRKSTDSVFIRWLVVPVSRWIAPALRDRFMNVAVHVRESVDALRAADVIFLLAAFLGSVIHVLCKIAALPLLVYLSVPHHPLTPDALAPLVLWPLALFYGGVVVPAPGGGGFIEGAFALTLRNAIPAVVFAASLLWWRFYTFYIYIIVGGAVAGGSVLRAIRSRSRTSEI